MTKIEELAFAYKKKRNPDAGSYDISDYCVGYEQAQKDLALTADEIRLIFNKVRTKQSMYNTTEGCYQEVADWFNTQRKK